MRAVLISLSVFASVLTGCGGGGDGSGGSSGDGSAQFSLSASSVTFEADLNAATPAPQMITGTISNAPLLTYVFAQYSGTVISNVIFTSSGAGSGTLTIFPRAPSTLGRGTFTEVITIRACLDQNCATQVAGSPKTISVTFRVFDLRTNPTALSLSSIENVPSPVKNVSLTNTVGSGWSTTVKYDAGASSWLTISPSSGTETSALVGVSGGALSVGTYTAAITFTSGSLVTTVPVTYNVMPNLRVSNSVLRYTAVAGQPIIPGPGNVAVFSFDGITLSYTTSVKYGAGANNWLAVSGNTVPGTLTVVPSTTTLPPGASYSATVTLTPSRGAPIDLTVTYKVDASVLQLSPTSVSYSLDASSTSIDSVLKRTIATSDSGAPVSWTATSSVPWLSVNPSSGTSGASVELSVDPMKLASIANGVVPATVTFTYDGPGFTGATSTEQVSLNLSLPTVDFVAPYVAYVSEQKPIIVRGSGLKQSGVTTIMFDTFPAQSVDIISDTEMRVVPPLVSTPSRLTTSIPNGLGVPRHQAELVVREHPNYAYSALDTSAVGLTNYNLVYDAERDAVIAARGHLSSLPPPSSSLSTVQRFAYDSGTQTWTRTSKFIPDLFDFALSPDGKDLLVLTTSTLYILDPVTLNVVLGVNLSRPTNGYLQELAVMNNGDVLIVSSGLVYSLPRKSFRNLTLGGGGIAASLDGSRAYFGFFNSPDIANYNASTGLVSSAVPRQQFVAARVNRDGARLLTSGILYNSNLSAIGRNNSNFAFLADADSLSPDGTRVYEYEYGSTPTKIHVLDGTTVTNPNQLNELSTIPLADNPGVAHSIVSLDGKALFIVGDQKFIVQPVP
jgi:hypothetical protein